MRPSLMVPVAVLCVSAAVAVASWRARIPVAAPTPRTGMSLLRAYACERGESKVVVVKGIEDDFSPAGSEPGFLGPEFDNARWRSVGPGSYDQSEPDRYFLESLQAPPGMRDGLFVVGLKPLPVADSANDTFALGEMGSSLHFGATIARLADAPGWKQEGALHYAQLGDILLNGATARERTLLDYVEARPGSRWIGILAQDDTSVDFVGLAACVKPPAGRGVTLMTDARHASPGVVALTCIYVPSDWTACNQYVGDTPCDTELPLACLLPGRHAVPRALVESGMGATWTGGAIAMTPPVAASRFSRIADADAFCAARFGSGWRTLTAHEGLPNLGVSGSGRPPPGPVRAWVDEVNQPYATCWRR